MHLAGRPLALGAAIWRCTIERRSRRVPPWVHGTPTTPIQHRSFIGLSRSGFLLKNWKGQTDLGANSGAAQVEFASKLASQTPGERKPQAKAGLGTLCVAPSAVERLEHPGPLSAGDARSVVANRELQRAPAERTFTETHGKVDAPVA